MSDEDRLTKLEAQMGLVLKSLKSSEWVLINLYGVAVHVLTQTTTKEQTEEIKIYCDKIYEYTKAVLDVRDALDAME